MNQIQQTTETIRNSSNGYKIAGLIFILIVVAVVFYGVWYVANDFKLMGENEPWLVRGTKIARTGMVIPGNKIKPSSDSQYGIEFSYSMWIYITDYTYKNDEYKHILHKGNDKAMPLQSPGIWLYPHENKMAINMNTYYSVKESCDIGNIPIGKWFFLVVSVVGKNIDVYINGRLMKRCTLKGVPKLNYGDVYINQWNGFDGFLSNVRYFNFAIPYYKIEQLFNAGPSKAPCTEAGVLPPYFAENVWMSAGYPNAPGPDMGNTDLLTQK